MGFLRGCPGRTEQVSLAAPGSVCNSESAVFHSYFTHLVPSHTIPYSSSLGPLPKLTCLRRTHDKMVNPVSLLEAAARSMSHLSISGLQPHVFCFNLLYNLRSISYFSPLVPMMKSRLGLVKPLAHLLSLTSRGCGTGSRSQYSLAPGRMLPPSPDPVRF